MRAFDWALMATAQVKAAMFDAFEVLLKV